ncbi:hypothetical protein ABZ366_12935 [Streptomyces sp. NPDC005904]|uniref:hypothetical protein n=1 Tax=Streptomyces sp. NPDC005904 TaxID=3154570 RepID=UPI0033FF5222
MSEGVRYCWRCDAPITKEHPSTSAVKASTSVGGATVRLHTKCPRLPTFVRRTPR